ncbi:MAG: hydrogenase maturation nickel metallochaperone HypA [Candidatus Limnocylindrales bacterium]
MHETGLAEGIADAVRVRAGDRAVARVRVRMGTLHRAGQGPMEQAFEMVVAGTPLEGVTLDLIQVPVTSTCTQCGQAQSADEKVVVCTGCGGTAMEYLGGDEIILEAIEYRAVESVAAGHPTG